MKTTTLGVTRYWTRVSCYYIKNARRVLVDGVHSHTNHPPHAIKIRFTPFHTRRIEMATESMSHFIRTFLDKHECNALAEHLQGMSYNAFLQTSAWTLLQWGASWDCIFDHTKLVYDTYRASTCIKGLREAPPGTTLEATHKDFSRGRRRTYDRGAPKVLRAMTTEEPVMRSRAQTMGDRCCGQRATYQESAEPESGKRGTVRRASPDHYRTKPQLF